MEGSVFWDITPCSLMKINQQFWGTCPLHLLHQRIGQTRNQREAGSKEGKNRSPGRQTEAEGRY
jgi:hypothetical protein